MLQMIKRDYLVNRLYFLIILIVMPFIYLVDLSPLFIYLGMIFGCIFNVFYYDHQNKVNRYLISTPIKRNQIVFARYLFIMLTILVFLIYLWSIDLFAHGLLPKIDWAPAFSFQPITKAQILFTFFMVTLMTAIIVPVYYCFSSVIKSLFFQFVLIILGIMVVYGLIAYLEIFPESSLLTILDFIGDYPVLSIGLITFVSLLISYQCSIFIFKRKDG